MHRDTYTKCFEIQFKPVEAEESSTRHRVVGGGDVEKTVRTEEKRGDKENEKIEDLVV